MYFCVAAVSISVKGPIYGEGGREQIAHLHTQSVLCICTCVILFSAHSYRSAMPELWAELYQLHTTMFIVVHYC